MFFLYFLFIVSVSISVSDAAVTIHNYLRAKRTGMKYFRFRIKKGNKQAKICLVVCLINFLFYFYQAISFYRDDCTGINYTKQISALMICFIWFCVLIVYIVRLLLSVWVSDRYIVYGTTMVPKEKASYLISDIDCTKSLSIYESRSKYPFIRFPVSDNDYGVTKVSQILKNNYWSENNCNNKKVIINKELIITFFISLVFLFISSEIFYCVRRPFAMIDDIAVRNDVTELHFNYLSGVENKNIHETEALKSDDLKNLKYLPDLRVLNVTRNSITDLKYIGELNNLEELYMGGGESAKNPDDYSPLDNLTNLKKFVMLEAEKFNGFEYLQRLPELTSLQLTHKELSDDDIMQINKIPSLTDLDISKCSIYKSDSMSELKKLKKICLNYFVTDSFEFVDELDNVECLELTGIDIKEYFPLDKMDSLKELYVSKERCPEKMIKMLESKGINVHLCL